MGPPPSPILVIWPRALPTNTEWFPCNSSLSVHHQWQLQRLAAGCVNVGCGVAKSRTLSPPWKLQHGSYLLCELSFNGVARKDTGKGGKRFQPRVWPSWPRDLVKRATRIQLKAVFVVNHDFLHSVKALDHNVINAAHQGLNLRRQKGVSRIKQTKLTHSQSI